MITLTTVDFSPLTKTLPLLNWKFVLEPIRLYGLFDGLNNGTVAVVFHIAEKFKSENDDGLSLLARGERRSNMQQ
jgi:hypothetical protein